MKPYLLIDVDGVLNPDRRTEHHLRYDILGFKVNLNPKDGQRLLNLSDRYELVWATTWTELANVHIGPKIGLPELPYIEWSVKWPTARTYPDDIMYKTRDVIRYAGKRPFAWLDDDLRPQDVTILPKNKSLPIVVDSRFGLQNWMFEKLEEWAGLV